MDGNVRCGLSRRMKTLLAGVLSLAVLAVAGCGGSGGVGSSGDGPKVVAVASSMNRDLSKALTNDFANRTGIVVEFEPLNARGLRDRLDSFNTSTADVWMGGTAEEYYLAGDRKLLVPYHPAAAANLPPEYLDREGQWTPLSIDRIAFLSNTDRLEELHVRPPETWIELLQPVLHNETILAVPEAGGASYGMITTLWQLWGQEKALQYAGIFRTQKPTYVPTDAKAAYAVFQGSKAVAVLPLRHARMLEREHRFLTATAVKDGNKNLITAVAILKGGMHRAEAQRFLDYLLSADASRIMRDYGFTPLLDDVLSHDRKPQETGPITNDDLRWAALYKQDIIKAWLNAK